MFGCERKEKQKLEFEQCLWLIYSVVQISQNKWMFISGMLSEWWSGLRENIGVNLFLYWLRSQDIVGVHVGYATVSVGLARCCREWLVKLQMWNVQFWCIVRMWSGLRERSGFIFCVGWDHRVWSMYVLVNRPVQ